MPEPLPLEAFLNAPGTMLDVRSPSEFRQGHIPGSQSLPLMTDQERALVGTAYKQQGPQEAIDLGLKLVGPKLYELMTAARSALQGSTGKILCWRGGMRSGIVARLLEGLGMPAVTLKGGYKNFRRFALSSFDNEPMLRVIGGLTGSGKTEILQELAHSGEQVIDLEALANHLGSAFGRVHNALQPTQEQFENSLAHQWSRLDFSRPVWIEDESRQIGQCTLPPALYAHMQRAPLFFIECPIEERCERLLAAYGGSDPDLWRNAVLRIRKKLGQQLTDEVLRHYQSGELKEACLKLLSYYDKAYRHNLSKRERVMFLAKNGRNILF